MALLEARDLVSVRGERTIFAGLGFALEAGEALVLTGPNGSGKSSLLRLLAGLLPPAAGTLLWEGRPVAAEPDAHRARLAYLGHQDPVKPVLTLSENLAFWTRLRGASDEGLEAALAAFGLLSLAELPGRLLSAGERRRLNLARLGAAPAPLWLLDEPTVGLDKAALAALEALLARHSGEGGVLVLATHLPLRLPRARELALERYGVAEAPP